MSFRRALIIAKTYPELSSKYGETVCTAAVDETGQPLRLYPIPFRYLTGPQRFVRYQWIEADIEKNARDTRPESFTVRADSIALGERVKATTDEWGVRASIVLRDASWQYASIGALLEDQQTKGTSIAFIRPRKIVRITSQRRSADDIRSFDEKFERLKRNNAAARSQLSLFEMMMPPEMKTLEFLGERVCVDWLCADHSCSGHSMQVLDWEICELARRDGLGAAKAKVAEVLNLDRYKSGLILGNMHMFPASFAIIGLWYPQAAARLF